MRILLAHNFYGTSSPSGENEAVLEERRLLERGGHEVVPLFVSSDKLRRFGILGSLAGGAIAPWNPFVDRIVERAIAGRHIDVAHLHNSFPILSPAVINALRKRRIPTVMTVHNYRLLCAAGTLSRKAVPCRQCFDSRSPFPALLHGCYRDSRVATIPVVAMIALHREMGTWRNGVSRFIALTKFQSQMLVEAGIPREKIAIKPPSFINAPPPVPWARRTGQAVYVGRLSDEKGIESLLDVWTMLGHPIPMLNIVGDGPLASRLQSKINKAQLGAQVIFHGQTSHVDALRILGESKLLILPSVAFEGYPMVVREALALGVPILATRHGSLGTLVREDIDGKLCSAGNQAEMRQCVETLFGHQGLLAEMSEAALERYRQDLEPDKNLTCLLQIYDAAISSG